MKTCEWCGVGFKPNSPKQRCCNKSCGQKLRQKSLGNGQSEVRRCLFCGTPFQVRTSSTKRCCNHSCAKKYDMTKPEYKAKIHNEKVWKKISGSNTKFYKTIAGQITARARGLTSRGKSASLGAIEKCRATKERNGTLHVWKGTRGGNGKYTTPQLTLWKSLPDDWELEVAVPTGYAPGEFGYPSNYKVDIGHWEMKVGIEVDGSGHRLKDASLLDVKKMELLSRLGWIVLRFTNEDVMKHLSRVLSEIKTVCGGM